MGSLSLPVLIGLIVVSVDSVRNIPSLAIFGNHLPIFFLAGIVLFLLPVSFISAELSATFSNDKDNGIYHWVKRAYGKDMGMFAIWNLWINSLIWFPANLLFIASTFLTIFFPNVASHQSVLITLMVAIFWFITLLNLKGIKESARVAYACLLLGVILPILILLVSAAIWLFKGLPTHFTLNHGLELGSASHNMSALMVIITSFLGVEITSVHINRVANPKRTFTIAILVAAILIVALMFIGSIAMAMMIPAEHLSLYNGLAQTFRAILGQFGLGYMGPAILCMVVLGSVGALISWTISPAIGMGQAARNGYMPKALGKFNKNGVPTAILLIQAVIITVFCLAITLFKNMNDFYWYLISLSTAIYLLMYMAMFFAGMKLRKQSTQAGTLLKNNALFYLISIAGLVGVFATFIISFIPSSQVLQQETLSSYLLQFGSGVVVVSLCYFGFVFYRKRNIKNQGVEVRVVENNL
ncbi:APC family permease [Vibrio sp. S4M6]|uniref:APC family permease n=1 Tax=Vibrio sinus TaxID=2946865 RepID=UPI002029C756|nr:APC family permease [Vibrio sinus]MCL9779965.1 APC family permease [Vibrio sinus]